MIATDQMIKIVMLGEGRVGKTSLTLKYINNQFDINEESTINADFLEKKIELGMGKSIQAAIWDTAGQEKFRALTPMYYRDASGAVLVYDISFRESFSRVINWVKELKMNSSKNEQAIQIVIAGNKCDLPPAQHVVTKEEADEFASKIGAVHILTSARTGQGTNIIFETLARKIVASQEKNNDFPQQREERTISYTLKDQQQQQQQQQQKNNNKQAGGGCC